MEGIRFGEVGYKSPYGKDGLRANTELNQAQNKEIPKDSFNPKYKSSQNKEAVGVLGTIALMAACVFAGFKGKDKIAKGMGGLKTRLSDLMASFKTKCPNLANAGTSLGEAGKNAGKVIGKPFQAIWTGIKNLVTTKKS